MFFVPQIWDRCSEGSFKAMGKSFKRTVVGHGAVFSTHDTTKIIQYVQFHRFAYSYASEKKKMCFKMCFGIVFYALQRNIFVHYVNNS